MLLTLALADRQTLKLDNNVHRPTSKVSLPRSAFRLILIRVALPSVGTMIPTSAGVATSLLVTTYAANRCDRNIITSYSPQILAQLWDGVTHICVGSQWLPLTQRWCVSKCRIGRALSIANRQSVVHQGVCAAARMHVAIVLQGACKVSAPSIVGSARVLKI